MKRMDAAHNHIRNPSIRRCQCWRRASFSRFDLPLLLAPLCPVFDGRKWRRRCRGTFEANLSTASKAILSTRCTAR
jgi:hypothetical protein